MNLKETILNDAKTAIAARAVGHHLVFGYLGMPGIGKTQIVHAVGDELGLEVWSGFNIAAASPMDVAIKMPDADEGIFRTLPSDDFPWESLVGDKPVLLFIDEVTNGTSDTIKSIQRLVNERKLGEHTLGKNVIVMLAGNRQSDKAGSGTLSTAMYNRVTWRNIEWSSKHSDDAVEFLLEKYHGDDSPEYTELRTIVAGYFAHKPINEGDFTDALKRLGKEPYVQWCSPRSLDALLSRVAVNGWKMPGVSDMAGDIGMGRATEMSSFKDLLSKLDRYEKVIADPQKAKLPDSVEAQYAMLAMLSQRVKADEFGKVWEYVSRISEVTMRLVFMRMAIKANKEITRTKEYEQAFTNDRQLKAAISRA